MNKNIFGMVIIILLLQGVKFEFITNETKNITGNLTKIETTGAPTLITSTVCEANNSCSSTSKSPDAITIAPTQTTATTNTSAIGGATEPPSKMFHFKQKKNYGQSKNHICVCDLKMNYCDINCCCDQDCSFEDKLVFGHCEDDFYHYDTRYCQYTKHVYINNTPHEFEINQNSLFCVMANNVPPSYLVQPKYPLKTLQDAEFQKIGKYSWPQRLPPNDNLPKLNYINYTYGKPLWIIRNSRLQTYQYTKSFIVPQCVLKEDLKYLMDVKSSCTHTAISEDNKLLNSEEYFKDIFIIANPGLLNISKQENNVVQKCPSTICLPAIPRFCDKYLENCMLIQKNQSQLYKLKCHLSASENRVSCSNLVQHVKYNFYHNGTQGIVKAGIFLYLVNFSYPHSNSLVFSQTFEVNFLWWNSTLNYSSYFSGNPGYLVGKPILTGNIVFVNVTNSTTKPSNNITQHLEPKLIRNSLDFTNNFLVLPYVNTDGICVLNKQLYTPVEFGFNYYLKCTIREVILYKNMSAKNTCFKIQHSIFKYWSLKMANNTLSNRLIGQFGNANIQNLEEWVHVMFNDDIKNILDRIWGKITNNILTCGNLTTLFTMDIFHTRIDFDNVRNQQKIVATTVQFADFKNVIFTLNDKGAELKFNIKVNSQIAFFDITTKKIRKIVDPPSLNIRLPHDFFYPFIKLNNQASRQTCELFVIYYVIIFLIVIF